VAFPNTAKVDTELPDVREYWLERIRQHFSDSYCGVPLLKLPEDLRVYEHMLWDARPNVLVELGTAYGGSALWFRDRMRALRDHGVIDELKVISVDIDLSLSQAHLPQDRDVCGEIEFIEGDVTSAETFEAVKKLLPANSRCMVVEDTAHEYGSTIGALQTYSELVPDGGYFVVEDGCVDVEHLRADDTWPRGVVPAINDWLATPDGAHFTMRRDLELYGITSHPYGYLQRTS
jgi:cephalosporin hydroxylase